MSKQSRYGFSDLVVDENVKLPKYAKIVDDEGNEHEIECYHIEDEEEDEEEQGLDLSYIILYSVGAGQSRPLFFNN